MGTMAAEPFKVGRIGGGKAERSFFTRNSPAIKGRQAP
jgi:hypothetical protein